MSDPQKDFQETCEIQGRSIHPRSSAWVSANAGSGKTYILTRRVIRLLIEQALLGGGKASPEKILCITFTKAAAAEMEQRLYDQLGKLSLCDDQVLADAVKDLGAQGIGEDGLRRVRTLFAQALETPGGLKIQTIHSFCERMLRRFPVEAGLPPGFKVAEEDAREVLGGLLGAAFADPCVASDDRGALDAVAREWPDAQSRNAVLFTLYRSYPYQCAPDGTADADHLLSEIRQGMGLPTEGEPDSWKASLLDPADAPKLEQLYAARDNFNKRLKERADACGAALEVLISDPIAAFDRLADAWISAKGQISYEAELRKELERELPGHAQGIFGLIERVLSVAQMDGTWRAFIRTSNAVRVAWLLGNRYKEHKKRRGIVDFDDLISHALRLLRDVNWAWVQYKLDNGLDHILLDEAQDTSGIQWSILEVFRNEIAAQAGDASRSRTVFVVGDKKQSIYAFQGADAALFAVKRAEMRKRLQGTDFTQEQLFLSFRSSPAILEFVDVLFPGEAASGVSDAEDGEELRHRAFKAELPGIVEVWPMVEKPAKQSIDAWDLPVDSRGEVYPARELAEQICAKIKTLLDPAQRRRLGNGKPIQPGDILILCQRRSDQFREIIRALARHEIPSGGADRIKLKEDIAVQDMLSLLRFSSNHRDDLSLAEALKSPLWGFSDEDLMVLSMNRNGVSLWAQMDRLKGEKSTLSKQCDLAMEQIRRAEAVGAQSGPFAFFSCLLETGRPSGWSRFRARLGQQSDEPLEELLNIALDFGNQESRSLAAFLAHIERLDVDVKKEPAEQSSVVRVMTVHGAKGLEAPIVFIADANYRPSMQKEKTLEIPLLSGNSFQIPRPRTSGPNKEFLTPALSAAEAMQRQKIFDEYRRKLYVAATRAEEELYVCGIESGKRSQKDPADLHELACKPPLAERAWLGLSVEAMRQLGDGVKERKAPWTDATPILRYSFGTPAQADESGTDEQEIPPPPPAWLMMPAPKDQPLRVEFPSAAADGMPLALPARSPRGLSGGQAVARLRGTFIHLLLEKLPEIAPDRREMVAWQLARLQLPGIAQDTQSEWIAEASNVLADRRFAEVFSPLSRAEVPVRGVLEGRHYSGQIDRLFVGETVVQIVDYKTQRPPPEDATDLSPEIANQLRIYAHLLSAIYPGRRVEAAILWTYAPRLMPVSTGLPFDPKATS
ncbi:MAG: double-strand break repair helicase AddA [Parvularcula sp.]